MKNIGIDIGMKTCVVCVMDEKKNVPEEAAYHNTLKDATEFARRAAGRHGRCRAVCESTGNMWLKSFEGFERAGIPIVLANPAKLKPNPTYVNPPCVAGATVSLHFCSVHGGAAGGL